MNDEKPVCINRPGFCIFGCIKLVTNNAHVVTKNLRRNNSREEQPYDQRLKEGFSGVGSVEPMDDTHFRQIGTLSLSEKADRYTLRAYECWEKRRFDTHEIRMKKVE